MCATICNPCAEGSIEVAQVIEDNRGRVFSIKCLQYFAVFAASYLQYSSRHSEQIDRELIVLIELTAEA